MHVGNKLSIGRPGRFGGNNTIIKISNIIFSSSLSSAFPVGIFDFSQQTKDQRKTVMTIVMIKDFEYIWFTPFNSAN